MNTIKLIIALLLLAAGGIANARGDHGHVRFGVMIGPYWGAPWHYPPYPYYYPPVVVQPQTPQVYIEQQPAAPVAEAPTNYWYYCVAAKGYYPYVKECPGGWQKVVPKPPGQP